MEILILITKVFWLLLPAGVANMSPVLVKWIPFLDSPIDGGRMYNGKPLLGANKTWRGLLFGTVAAILVILIQRWLSVTPIEIINYSNPLNLILIGFLMGIGALVGDAVASFFKRQVGIKSGDMWIIADQIDWVLGAFVFTIFYISFPIIIYITGILLFGLLHPIINLIGYWLGIKKNKF